MKEYEFAARNKGRQISSVVTWHGLTLTLYHIADGAEVQREIVNPQVETIFTVIVKREGDTIHVSTGGKCPNVQVKQAWDRV